LLRNEPRGAIADGYLRTKSWELNERLGPLAKPLLGVPHSCRDSEARSLQEDHNERAFAHYWPSFRPYRGNDMKKTFALAAVLALGVVACSPAAEEAADTAADETAVTEDAMAAEAAPAEGDAMAAEAAPAEGEAAAEAPAAEAPAAEAAPAE
jgi:hypothetical protein